MKQCRKCKEWKQLDDFYLRYDNHSRDGHTATCKSCTNSRTNEWARRVGYAHKQYVRFIEYFKNYREAHKHLRKPHDEKYYQTHKEQALIANRKWQDEHSDRVKELARNRYADNPQKDLARSHRRRVLIEQNGGDYTQEQWNALCDKFNRRCPRCGKESRLTVDHVIPLSRGGTNTIDNIQPLCKSCNTSKGTKTIDYR